MPAFGEPSARALAGIAERAQRAATAKRADALADFDQFCAAQRARVATTLKAQEQRIAAAKFGAEEEQFHFVVSRKGITTEASRPVKHEYQAQR